MSRFGVKPRFAPRNPMRSARTVSRVIRITLGGAAAAASALAPSQTTHSNCRIRDIGKRLSKFIHWKNLRLELALLFDSLCSLIRTRSALWLAITFANRQRVAFWLQREPC